MTKRQREEITHTSTCLLTVAKWSGVLRSLKVE
jgi:hypothetical protein